MFDLEKDVVHTDFDALRHELVLETLLRSAPNAPTISRLNPDNDVDGNGRGQRQRLLEQRRVRQVLRLVHFRTVFSRFSFFNLKPK